MQRRPDNNKLGTFESFKKYYFHVRDSRQATATLIAAFIGGFFLLLSTYIVIHNVTRVIVDNPVQVILQNPGSDTTNEVPLVPSDEIVIDPQILQTGLLDSAEYCVLYGVLHAMHQMAISDKDSDILGEVRLEPSDASETQMNTFVTLPLGNQIRYSYRSIFRSNYEYQNYMLTLIDHSSQNDTIKIILQESENEKNLRVEGNYSRQRFSQLLASGRTDLRVTPFTATRHAALVSRTEQVSEEALSTFTDDLKVVVRIEYRDNLNRLWDGEALGIPMFTISHL